MDFFDEINGLEYLFFIDLEEQEDNQLIINIKEATIAVREEDIVIGTKSLGSGKAITYDGLGKQYALFFENYVAYCVINESFSILHNYEERIGRLLCIYSKSNYLDYIRKDLIAEYVREGELKHYAINCLNHIIYIASMDEPAITRK